MPEQREESGEVMKLFGDGELDDSAIGLTGLVHAHEKGLRGRRGVWR